jgi:hypothetical protein
MDLLRKSLPDVGEHVIAALDQVKGIDRDCSAGQLIRRAWRNADDGSTAFTTSMGRTPKRH